MVCHDPVFPGHWHNVGSDADGDQVKKTIQLILICQPVALGEGLHELKSYATPAEVRIGISVAFHFGIENGICLRQNVVGDMVVAYDEINAFFLGIVDFINGLDAAIQHNYKFDTNRCSIVNTFN